MNINDFDFIAKLLKERSGLVLGKDKAYLLESRLNPVARKWQFRGFEDLVQALRSARDQSLLQDVVEAMTTNESFFFRDQKPFDQFRDLVMPEMLQARAQRKQLRIWSAACSSGQEPYSLAMILSEMSAKLAGWKIEIVATDLSHEILAKAKAGLYSQFEVQRGLPIQLLMRYFAQEGDRWRINDKIRQMVTFRPLNLLQPLDALGSFDVVFCRNVLIYFDQDTKSRVLEAIAGRMAKDGFLYLGGAETVLGLTKHFELQAGQRGVYRPADAAAMKRAG